ncbi:MAG: FlgD immunoglobulin-like domain containing protein [bacterium]
MEYTLGARTHVRVVVYDLLGRHVTTLVDETQSAGDHATSWDGTDAEGNPSPTGVYFYRIETKYFRTAKKMMLLK